MRCASLFGSVTVLVLAGVSYVIAQDDPRQATARLEEIRLQVISTESQIANIQREFNELVARRTTATESLRRLRREDQEVEQKLLQVEEERRILVVQLAEAEERLKVERERSAKRLRGIYTETSIADAPLGSGSRQQVQVERIAVYSRAVRESDNRRFGSLRTAANDLITSRQRLEDSIRDGQELRAEILLLRQDAERKQQELKKIAREIQSRKDDAQRSLALLKKEAVELELLIASITSGRDESESDEEDSDEEHEEDEDSADEAAQKPEPKDDQPQQIAQRAPEQSTGSRSGVLRQGGLFASKATLSAPIKGQIVQHFGKLKLASFKDVLFSKGIEFAAPESEKIYAVLDGRVAFSGNLPGYDTVVIIDHGARSYSLYGRLGQSLVKKDDAVQQDQIIGTPSPADKQGRNFYFEVRRAGKALDPETILPRISR